MDLVGFDVLTANSDLSSICQIAAVHFKDGMARGSWQPCRPNDYFDPRNRPSTASESWQFRSS